MNENSQKKRSSYNNDVIRILKERHGYTAHYIRQSLRGDRVGIIPDRLKKEYYQMENAAKKAVQEIANQQISNS